MKSFIEFLYSAFIGIAVVLFVGFGIWAFYPGPEMPEHPSVNYTAGGELAEEDKIKQTEFDKTFEDYNEDSKAYSKRVATIALVPAALFFIGGLRFMKRNDVVGEGLAMGGVFTAVYALIRAGHSGHRVVVFVVASALLVMVIMLAQTKFQADKPSSAK